jgi:AP-2 complex subunit alpha
MEGPSMSQQTVIKSPRDIDLAWLTKLLSAGLRLSVLSGVDPNLNNVVAAGAFATSASKVPCLVRIETNSDAQMYRVTVKSTNPQLVSGVIRLLETHLA